VELVVLRGGDSPAVRQVTREFPLLPLRIHATDGPPLPVLTEAGKNSELLVLGCRGHRHHHLGLGTLVLPTIVRAECDTVVLRGADDAVNGQHRRVTAMIGGDADDAFVLVPAAGIALAHRAELRVWHATPPPFTHHEVSTEQDPSAVVAAAEARVASLPRRPATTIELVRAYPHEVVAGCTDSDLLVVGRGRSGAVTRTALHLAPCPVMVVSDVEARLSPAEPTARRATWSPCLPWPRDEVLTHP
jgi:nucleotide-binding universal stress UspA family protein